MINKEIEDKLNDIVFCIKDSDEYKKCIEIKKQMDKNSDLTQLITEIKELQKKYIRENDDSLKKELQEKEKQLNQIPIYIEYNNYLREVNEKINLIKESLNEYFDEKLNGDITEIKSTN